LPWGNARSIFLVSRDNGSECAFLGMRVVYGLWVSFAVIRCAYSGVGCDWIGIDRHTLNIRRNGYRILLFVRQSWDSS